MIFGIFYHRNMTPISQNFIFTQIILFLSHKQFLSLISYQKMNTFLSNFCNKVLLGYFLTKQNQGKNTQKMVIHTLRLSVSNCTTTSSHCIKKYQSDILRRRDISQAQDCPFFPTSFILQLTFVAYTRAARTHHSPNPPPY